MEDKVKEFIKLFQGHMSVQEFSLKFITVTSMIPVWCLILYIKWFTLWLEFLIPLRKNVMQKCFMIIWTFHVQWCIHKKFRRQVLERIIGMTQGQDWMMEVLPRVNLRFKIIKGLRRYFPTKVLPMLQGSTKVMCLTLRHKEEDMVVLMFNELVVKTVARRMKASDSLAQIISLVVGKVVIWGEISLCWKFKEGTVSKNKKLIHIPKLPRWTTFILSIPQVINRAFQMLLRVFTSFLYWCLYIVKSLYYFIFYYSFSGYKIWCTPQCLRWTFFGCYSCWWLGYSKESLMELS